MFVYDQYRDLCFYLFNSVPDIDTCASYELEYIFTMLDSTSIKNIRTKTHLLLKVHNITTDLERNKP